MMHKMRWAMTTIAAGALVACAADAGSPEQPAAEPAAAKPALEAAVFDPTTLAPFTFRLVELPEAATAVGPAVMEIAFAAQPDGSWVASGHGPCNQFSSPVAFTGERVEFTQLVTTKRACADLGVETEWFGRLRAGGDVKLEGTRLQVSREGKTTMVLEGTATPP